MRSFGPGKSIRNVATVFALGVGFAHGQATNSGDIRGTVTDPTGALVPDVVVTVTNVNTGVTKILKTNQDGLYDTSSIVVGTYSVTFERPGFEKYSRPQISLQVGTSTVNAIMKVGSATDQVVVNTDLPLLDTETGTQQTTFEAKSMELLPNVGQDWQNFAILIPGSAGLAGGTNPGQSISANGNLPYSNILADGASTTLGTSSNSDVNTFETVQEVQISTSAFSAQYGIGGIIFNQISKGGTRQFHGAAYDYFSSSQFNANSYQFAGQSNSLAFDRRNNFGASVGGPVAIPFTNLKNKAFFYFNYDQIVDHGSASGTNDIPSTAVMGGDFTGQSLIYDPTTQTMAKDSKGNSYPVRKSFLSEYGFNAIPTSLFDKVSANFQKFFPTPANHIVGGHFQAGQTNGQGILQRNFYASVPQSNPDKKYFGRLDYDISPSNRLTFSVTQGDNSALYPNTVTAQPIGASAGDISRLNSQVTDVWNINDHFINEARFGFTYQGNFFSDQTFGKGYPAQLGFQFAQADEIPGVQFITNYPYAWIQPESSQFIYKENVFDPSDVVTLIRGKHVLHFGGEVGIYRNDNTPYAQINPGTFQFSGQYTQNWAVNGQGVAAPDSNTGADYADFLLGDALNWGAQNGSEYGARLKNPQVFIQDDYKIRPNLTLNLGLRYQVRLGINEVHGNVGTFDPTIVNTANGQLGAYWYGQTHANGRTSLQDSKYSTLLPRVGFAFLPTPNMTIRGGFGVYAYNLSLDTYGGGLGNVNTQSGNYQDPTNGITPGIIFSGPGTENLTGTPLPFTKAGTSPTRFNGQSAGYTAYHTPDPKIYQWNFGIQQAIGTNMVFELSYVASHAFNLNFPTDINQVPTALLAQNDSQSRPNHNYTSINGSTNDAISNYNSLQTSINRRLASGLSLNFNYTWAHFLDDQDSSGMGSKAGPISRQFADAPSNYSNSNFDIRNSFKGRIVYQLPIGRGRAFLNHNWLVDELLGGYQVSSTIQLTSGNPFSVFASNQHSYDEPGQSDDPFPNYSGAPLTPAGGHSTFEWYNPAAFTLPAPGTFGNVRRNSVYGPGSELVNLSAGKKFDIHESVKLQIRLDATNAFNHANFGQPNGNLGTCSGPPNCAVAQQAGQAFTQSGSFGAGNNQITGAGGGRSLQGGIRLEY
ncbi:TonB-dependent receptor [Granulicella tundricola]|uniref:TonB-dependent receptor n=1 Tax=Granulicella tundricola (strain ATCC BAA-1859 / DSM 23138 / MP5ACTX9) TaxID=1198114 RepID=E8X6W1_GRATM|nr:TonB-dependent receptor [Granulicella tundricola]ADW71261.1 TonB-dependent receptor [Granulicella tundricola MP5ACTX9]